MPAARYFRGLTTFDFLGNLLPGTVVLAAVLSSLPDPPTPTTPGGYLLFGVVAFSLGHFVQQFSSVATGDRRSFDWTMDAARQQGRAPEAADAGDTDLETGEIGRDETGREGTLPDEASVVESRDGRLVRLVDRVRRAGVVCFDALFDPLLWWRRSPRGSVLEERIVANLAWKHLLDSYELPPGTDDHSVLFHLMSSELDDVATPSRAVRFQAIRNFHRGMWAATWSALTLWIVVVIVDSLVVRGAWVLGVQYRQASLFELWSPVWHVLATLALGVVGFRRLAAVYEQEFVEYLFTDFVVATREHDVEPSDGSD